MGDYYRVLGLNYGARQDEIKLAFRKLALLHHPDRHISSTKVQQEEAAARFKAITEAYDVLTDDRKRAQYEASVRSGGVGGPGYGSSSSSSSRSGSGRYSYSYHSHYNVNTDWSYSRYSHRDHAHARISWFQQLQRAVGTRKLEAGLTLAGVGLLLFGGSAVDAMWVTRNHGKSFNDMQAARMSSAASIDAPPAAGGSGEGSGGGGQEQAVDGPGGGSRRPKPYSPAVGCKSRHSVSSVLKQRRSGGLLSDPEQRHLAELPLAELLAAEEAACQHQHQHQEAQEGQRPLKRQSSDATATLDTPSATAVGGGRGGGRGVQADVEPLQEQEQQQQQHGFANGVRLSTEGAGDLDSRRNGHSGTRGGGSGIYVDRAVVLPAHSPPGQMAGHRPPPTPRRTEA